MTYLKAALYYTIKLSIIKIGTILTSICLCLSANIHGGKVIIIHNDIIGHQLYLHS